MSVNTFDFYAELQAILNPNSIYSKDKQYDLENYIESTLEELSIFFKSEMRGMFKDNVKKTLQKVLD